MWDKLFGINVIDWHTYVKVKKREFKKIESRLLHYTNTTVSFFRNFNIIFKISLLDVPSPVWKGYWSQGFSKLPSAMLPFWLPSPKESWIKTNITTMKILWEVLIIPWCYLDYQIYSLLFLWGLFSFFLELISSPASIFLSPSTASFFLSLKPFQGREESRMSLEGIHPMVGKVICWLSDCLLF